MISLLLYSRKLKILDFIVGLLIFFQVHYIAILVALAIKLIIEKISLTCWPSDGKDANMIKLMFEASSLASVFSLIFIDKNILNDITLGCFITIVTLYPVFDLYKNISKRDISEVSDEEEETVHLKDNPYILDEVEYIRKIDRHMRTCVVKFVF